MATKKKAARRKFLSLDAVIALEGLTRKQIGVLQSEHGLRIYEVLDSLVVEEGELHEVLDQVKREVKLR